AFQKLTKRLGIPLVKIVPYNHRANGVVERGHFNLRESIVKGCEGNIKNWPLKVPEIVFADRITVSRVTGFSPFQLLHATDPILPLDLAEATFMVEEFRTGMTTSDLLVLRARQIAKHPDDLARATRTLQHFCFKSKEQFEKRFHHQLTRKTFNPGELVLPRCTSIELSHDCKSKQQYLGPYEVALRTEGGNYKLNELDGTRLKLRYGARRLIPYISR
ncbi:hypothetical protein CPB83DRAFT_748348, partial [Crepidotus variabilis]